MGAGDPTRIPAWARPHARARIAEIPGLQPFQLTPQKVRV
jgi:hypothetical protein